MTKYTGSREAPASLAEVIERIAAQEDMPLKQRQELTSAVRSFCRLLHLPPDVVAAEAATLRRHMAEVSPAAGGMSKTRWQNVKSLVGKALDIAGAVSRAGRPGKLLPPAWRDLLDAIGDRYQRLHLSKLAGYCAENDIAPEAVDDTVITAFAAYLSCTNLKRPKQIIRDACIAWNEMADGVPDWHRRKLTVPNSRRDYALPLTVYPESFQTDVEDFLSRLSGDDLFGERGGKPASPITLRNRRLQLRQLAAALVYTGRDPQSILSLADLVEVGAAKAALTFTWNRNGKRQTGQLHQFALLLVILAKHWARVAPEQIEQLRQLRRQVAPAKTGMTLKNRQRLMQFTDDTNVRKVLDLPRRLIDGVLAHDSGGIKEALTVQTALAIAIELAAPIRVENLAGLNIERHFRRTRSGHGAAVHLVIPAHEVKNRAALEFRLPPEVVKLLDLYVARFWPRLVEGPNPWLFPNRRSGAKAPAQLGTKIADVILERTGIRMNVHLFRHLAGFLYLRAHPGDFLTVSLLLAHKDVRTTINYYAFMDQDAALRRYDRVLDRYRESLEDPHVPR